MSYSRTIRTKGNTIVLYADTKKFEIDVQKVGDIVAATLFLEKQTNKTVEVYFLTNRSMRRINGEFRGKDASTNVLSFEFSSEVMTLSKTSAKRPILLGEVYLAPSFIKQRGEDISFLSIHGTLHLLGYDHKKKADEKRMERREGEIYARLTRGL